MTATEVGRSRHPLRRDAPLGQSQEPQPRRHPRQDSPFLLIFNGGLTEVDFPLPGPPYGDHYTVVIDTASMSLSRPGGTIPRVRQCRVASMAAGS